MKRVLLGATAALVLAAGNLAGATSADAAPKTGPAAETQGLSLVMCYYFWWMC